MAVFDTEIITIEGGYSNSPMDLGGETKYGISKRSYPNLDIENLTVDQAIIIYTRDYWDKNSIGSIHDQTTANLIFRFIVNIGAVPAIRIVQNSLNTFVPVIPSVIVDGIMGTRTIQAINNIRTIRLQDTLRVAECRYYLDFVNKNSSEEIFFKSWISRALM